MERRKVEQEVGTKWAGARQHHHLPSDGGGAPLLINVMKRRITKAAGIQGPGAVQGASWSQGCTFQTSLAPLPEHPFLTSAQSLLCVIFQRDPPGFSSLLPLPLLLGCIFLHHLHHFLTVRHHFFKIYHIYGLSPSRDSRPHEGRDVRLFCSLLYQVKTSLNEHFRMNLT